jgi:predicted RNA binding protein YcfA (HicA-like mRNA interferase family)
VTAADKLLDRMRANPRDWRIEDIAAVCRSEGIACTAPRKGSHFKLSHPAVPAILTVPAARPIKPVYVRELVRFVDTVREAAR